MGQEFFGGSEYFAPFDPEKFAWELREEARRRQKLDQGHEDSVEDGGAGGGGASVGDASDGDGIGGTGD